MTDLAIGLICVLAGVVGGLLIGFLLLKLLLPPLISRAFLVRENIKITSTIADTELENIRNKLNSKVNEDDRKKIIKDVADYFDTFYPDGFPGAE